MASTPDTDATRLNNLSSVTCPASGDCWAVGTDDASGNFLFRPLVEHEAGGVWSMEPSGMDGSTTDSVLDSVACAGPSTCVAVGYQGGPSSFQPFAEVYAAAPVAGVPDLPWGPLATLGLATAAMAGGVMRSRRRRSPAAPTP